MAAFRCWLYRLRREWTAVTTMGRSRGSDEVRLVPVEVRQSPARGRLDLRGRRRTRGAGAPADRPVGDEKFGDTFDRVAKGVGTRVIKTAVRAPNMNPIGERFVGSLRREALDHVLLLGEQKLEDIARQYVLFFNKSRA
jgi:hypothetical protein